MVSETTEISMPTGQRMLEFAFLGGGITTAPRAQSSLLGMGYSSAVPERRVTTKNRHPKPQT